MTSDEQDKTQFSLGDWTAEVAHVHAESNLVGIRFTKLITDHVGLDVDRGQFIEMHPALEGAPINIARELGALVTHARALKKREDERYHDEEKQDLLRQLEDTKAEVARLREKLQMRNSEQFLNRPLYDGLVAHAEYCAGNCSRGGDGPSCRKMGCVG